MPFTPKSKRRFGRHVITLRQLTLANWEVTEEMDALGLWCPRLDAVQLARQDARDIVSRFGQMGSRHFAAVG